MDDKLSLQQLTPRRFLHPVPYWATLHRHHGLKSVSSIWCRRQTEPSAHRHLANCPLERNGRNVVALVDNHEPVAGRYLREVVSAGKTLNHRQVDHTTRLPLRTDLSDALLSRPRYVVKRSRHCSMRGWRSTITKVAHGEARLGHMR